MISSDNSSHHISCENCPRRSEFFCNLPENAFTELQGFRSVQTYPRNSTLFMEGQPAEGVYLICSGHVKLSAYSEDGRAIILRIADPGELLGLSAVISSSPYEKTAQARDDCRISFIRKSDFLVFVQKHHQAALNALRQLSSNYHKAHQQICSLGLSASVADKLAKLLLQWCEGSEPGVPVRLIRTHTHGEIAEMIGTSRETVTRMLKELKDRGLVNFSRSEISIPDWRELKSFIGTRHRNGHS